MQIMSIVYILSLVYLAVLVCSEGMVISIIQAIFSALQ